MDNTIQLYLDKEKQIKGYPITSPDRVIDENGVNVKDEIEEINSSLDNKASKNEVFSMANMGQDIKEAMTGGSVAIVGRNTILNENIVDNQITNNKLSDENFVCVYNDFENLSSNTDTNGNWCNNFVYEKGFVKSIKVKINGEITQQGKIYLYEKLENGNIIYRKEYDINGVGYVIIPVNENIEYDFMLSTKCANVGYAYLEIGVKSANLGGTTTEFSPKFNENYIFSIGVNYDGIVNRLKKVEETTNNLNINNLRYSKLKYCALGDSITKGENSLNGYNPMIGERYTDLAQEYFSFRETVNLGKGGSRITRHTQDGDTKYGMIDRLDTIPWDTDILCIFGGTNDFGNNVKIGTIDSYDYTNFKFCVNEIIKTTLSYYPNIKMYFITPIHRNDWLADNIPNAVGHTLKDYVDTIKEVCEIYGIPVLDLWSIYGISPFIESQRSMFMPDGLHPIPLGMKRLAELNNKFIENMF